MSSTPKKYRFHSVFLFFRRRSALTFLFRYSKFLLNFFKKLLTNYFSHSMISNVSGRQIQNNLHMREWLSWWSTTLPRSGPRVRVPSRALLLKTGNFDLQGFLFFCCSVKVDYGFSVISIYFSDFPHYHLVWYNFHSPVLYDCYVVIPCYHLVWYNVA